jgi:probable HAF family extracellular repeat protein
VLFGQNGTPNLDLGTLGGSTSAAYAINAASSIVGTAQIAGDTASHAALFNRNGTPPLDLGTLGGTNAAANAINTAGLIVGYSNIPGDTAIHATLYRGGTLLDLNNLIPTGTGIVLISARGINDAGQIAINGTDATGRSRAYRLDLVTYLISARVRGAKKGTVLGGGSYPEGTRVMLLAKPKRGKQFLHWKEGQRIVSRKKRFTFTVGPAPRTFVASFQ